MGSLAPTMPGPFTLSPGLWALLDVLATYRLTRLVTHDRITEGLRRRIAGQDEVFGGMARPQVFDFITCPWCVGVWLAAAVVAATALFPLEWRYGAYVLACAAVAGFLMER